MGTLLTALPASTVQLYGGEQNLQTVASKVRALKGLANLHSGEALEVDSNRTTWHLEPVSPGSASGDGPSGSGRWSEQWFCLPDGEEMRSLPEDDKEAAFQEFGMTNNMWFTSASVAACSLRT